jgi:branched-chain amino acid transport system ATP-binding protein
MSSARALLQIDGLSKSYGDFRAVKEVSFALHHREMLALIGPNGAGKTTCFNMIMGQIAPTSGSIRFAEKTISGQAPRHIWRLGVGRTFQIASVFASMTVEDNLRVALHSKDNETFSMTRWRRHSDREVGSLLAQVGLADSAGRAAAELPYGDVKRLELAMALANAPKLLLMDEPTAGMAPSERESLMRLVAKLVQDVGMAVLFTEHDMDAVFAHADRVLVLDRGRLIAQGTPKEVRENALVQEVYLGNGSTFQ